MPRPDKQAMTGMPEPWEPEPNRFVRRCRSCGEEIPEQAAHELDFVMCRCVAYVPSTGERVYRVPWSIEADDGETPPDPEYVSVQTRHGWVPVPQGTRRMVRNAQAR